MARRAQTDSTLAATAPTPPDSTATDPDTSGDRGKPGRSAPRAPAAKPSGAVRLRKACDSCSIRKVKCDESGPPCKACFDLSIPCTFQRPTRRRGPPNRHAEAVRKTVQERGDSSSSSKSPGLIPAPLSKQPQPPPSAESICPLPALRLLLDDFFLYIHPLIPVPHEPTFWEAFENREDLQNPRFLALLAAMVSTLVVSFPRKPRQHLKAHNVGYRNSLALISKCHEVAVEARGPGFLDREHDIYDIATSYFLGLTAAYSFNFRRCRLYLSECLALLRLEGIEKHDSSSSHEDDSFQSPTGSKPVNHIKEQTILRLFWLLLAGSRTLQQLGAPFTELTTPPPGLSYHYPPRPASIDDQYITTTQLGPQPPNRISRLVGFNINIDIFTSYDALIAMEMGYGLDLNQDWTRQKAILGQCLKNIKDIVARIPPGLALCAGSEPGHFGSPLLSSPSVDGSQPVADDQVEQEKVPFEIQKANIYGSQLGTRSYVIEKYWSLYETSLERQRDAKTGLNARLHNHGEHQEFIRSERKTIVQDLLVVLRSISQVSMEPNSASFINKVRLVASTLLNIPPGQKGEISETAEFYLQQFVAVLMKLERLSSDDVQDAREESELQHWADLRDCQRAFVESGGVLSGL